MRKIIFNCRTKNIEEFREAAKFAKENNMTHMVISQVEPSMWQWNKDRTDPYPNWGMLQASLFKIIVPDKLKEFIPEDFAKRNLEMFLQRAAVLKEYGLKAVFIGMEPAWMPEEVYRKHPSWRGPRCDQPRRARRAYYAPCIDNPEVLALYEECIEKLCKIIPIEYFEFLTNDSGGGICWSERLYPGANGPSHCESISVADRAVNFLSVIQHAAAKVGVTAEVGYVRNFKDFELVAIAPKLKDGQFCQGRTNGATVVTKEVYGNGVKPADATFPLVGIPLTVKFMEQMMETVGDENSNIYYQLSSIYDKEYLEIIKKGTTNLKKSAVSKYENLRDVAAVFVGNDNADKLVNIWEQIHIVQDRLGYLHRGGHVFELGTTHQRWLTRPFVAFPAELTAEEKSFYRDFIFQARSEEEADNMLHLQATVWCSGESGRWLFSKTMDYALSALKKALKILDELLLEDGLGEYRDTLEELKLKLRMYRCIIKNANHVVDFQNILDRTDYNEEVKDSSIIIDEQGDKRLYKIDRIVRAEIDNTYEMISILDAAKKPLIEMTDTVEEKFIMKFGPDLKEDLLKKIDIMENHSNDFTRLYATLNR